MKLSDGEKLILMMLADMYKHLKIKGDFDPEFITHTISHDHLWGFNWQYQGIPFAKSEEPPEVGQTVDILDMWNFIEDSYEKLSPADKKKVETEAAPFGKNVKFVGFDGNHEEHYHIALYLVNRLEKFSSFKERDMNSHHPSIDGYKRMYKVFEPIRKLLTDRLLSADEIITILKARSHK